MCSDSTLVRRTKHRKAPRGPHRIGIGFSLVEIMVVLVIIGLLAGLVSVNVRSYLAAGKRKAAQAQIATFCQALETYYATHDRYPGNDEGLELLAAPRRREDEALLPRVPKDPWGRPYQYNQPGRHGPYEVISYGADGREGGEGPDADVSSWQFEGSD